jgi:FYVE zinc finger
VGADELTAHIGFAPIQILGAAALDASAQKDVLGGEIFMRLMSMITTVADCLVRHGARLSLDEPPTMRSIVRSSGIADFSVGSGGNLPLVDRSKLKIHANQNLADMLGMDRLDASQMVWNSVKAVNACSGLILHDDTKSAIPDSQAPGGSSEKNCAICWRVFGALRFRRHRCRITKRHVCDECSSKRIIANGVEHRISDGQFLLAKENDARQESERLVAERQQDRIKRAQTAQHAGAATARLDRLEAEDRAQRDSLFGGVMEKMTTAVFGDSEAKDAASKASGEVSGLFASLGQTRDALNERGDKLNSLAEKSDKLVNASKDFASMAKELNRATSNKGLFW